MRTKKEHYEDMALFFQDHGGGFSSPAVVLAEDFREMAAAECSCADGGKVDDERAREIAKLREVFIAYGFGELHDSGTRLRLALARALELLEGEK